MTKLTYALAAAATIAIAAPTIASAQGVGVYIGSERGYFGDRYDTPRARIYDRDREIRHDWHHREFYRDREPGVVVREHSWDY